MIFGDDFDGVFRLVFVVLAGDAEEFAPIIDFGGAVRMHRAMDDHGGFTGLVSGGDAADVIFVRGIREAFVVNDHVVWLGPIGIFVEIDLSTGAGAAFVDDGEFNIGDFGNATGERFGLEFVVMAAAAGDDESLEWFAGVELLGGAGGESERDYAKRGDGADQ